MRWFFPIFFGAIGVAVVIYVILLLKDLFTQKKVSRAVVKSRRKEAFPLVMGGARHDRTDYQLIFLVPGSEKEMQFNVSKELYDASPVGTAGELSWKGNHLVSFLPAEAGTDMGTGTAGTDTPVPPQ